MVKGNTVEFTSFVKFMKRLIISSISMILCSETLIVTCFFIFLTAVKFGALSIKHQTFVWVGSPSPILFYNNIYNKGGNQYHGLVCMEWVNNVSFDKQKRHAMLFWDNVFQEKLSYLYWNLEPIIGKIKLCFNFNFIAH